MKHSDPLLLLVEAHDTDPEQGAAPADSPQAQALMERILAEPRTSRSPEQEHIAARRLRASWPARLAAAGATVAVVAVAAISYSRLPTDDAPTEVAVASGVTGFVVPSGGCTVRNATPQEAARAISFPTTEELPLYRVDAVWTSGCDTFSQNSSAEDATPVVTYLRVRPEDRAATGALTLWRDVVDNEYPMPGTETAVAVGSVPGTLLHGEDEVYRLTWDIDGSRWQITASGVSPAVVLEFAEALGTHGSTDALPPSVDGMEQVDTAPLPEGPAVLVDLSYTRQVEDETTGEAVFLTLRPRIPWETRPSGGGARSDGTGYRVVDVDGAMGLSFDDGTPEDPSATLIWNLPSGQTAMLWGSGDTEDWIELAENLETTTATDPRIVDNLNQRAPFRGR